MIGCRAYRVIRTPDSEVHLLEAGDRVSYVGCGYCSPRAMLR